jgi:hypothetical protein
MFIASQLGRRRPNKPFEDGLVVSNPVVGKRTFIWFGLDGRCVITTPIKRIVALSADETYVQTKDQTFRLEPCDFQAAHIRPVA